MSATTQRESVASALRPVVVVVVTAKMMIAGFLVASMAGFVPMPATAEQPTTVYIADQQ
ncbi:hypothetical protein [Pararhizobium haloflavum]|uniref:hypothetical protein n=1 Tax=Pararhizobium haloflavum TaxID=2037914 RepID=UPI0012FFE864|nr:hypothetical protein [Pararhizobium haloflavum]